MQIYFNIIKYKFIYIKMASEKILLSLPEKMLERLEAEKKRYAYSTVQEVISETLRKEFFRNKESKKETRGRPRKLNEMKILTGKKKIWDREGVRIPI